MHDRVGTIGDRSVLIGFANALAAIEAAWSLVDAGFHVIAFNRRGRRTPLKRNKGVRVVDIDSPEEAVADAVTSLQTLAAEVSPAAVLPLDDAAIWLCDRAFAESFVPVAGPLGELALLALDKRVQLDAARAAGLDVPPTIQIESHDTASAILEYPVILKPALAIFEFDGRLQRGRAVYCSDANELESALETWRGRPPLLAQPMLSGIGEGLFGLATATGVHAWSAHLRVRMMNPAGSGSSACVSSAPDPTLTAAGERFIADVRWRGLFMLEFLREAGGKAWFMELNGRPWGSTALSRRLGFEYPAWSVAATISPDFRPPEPESHPGVVCRHLGRELVHLMIALRGRKSKAISNWPSRWRALREVLRFDRQERWYNWRRGASRVFLEDTVATVVEELTASRKRA
jgi:hypothetical protein